jgi:hypothetical protein
MDKDREDGRCCIFSSTHDISHVKGYGTKKHSYATLPRFVSYTQSARTRYYGFGPPLISGNYFRIEVTWII